MSYRHRSSSRFGVLAIGSVIVVAALLWWLAADPHDPGSVERLTVYCAAGLKPPVEAAAEQYRREHGVTIELSYGGSGTLLSSLSVVARGDLYVAGDDSYIELARERGLCAEALPAARMRPVLAVAGSNPKGVRNAGDLARDDLRVGLANPDAAAVGKLTERLLTEAGVWERVAARAIVYKPTVTELANDLVIGAIDVAVIWDATAAQYEEIDAIEVAAFADATRDVTIGVLTHSRTPTAALQFARYLTARDKGLPHWQRHGYAAVDGDAWAERPELTLYSGAMLNPAIDATVRAFERREGVRVTTVYNGCGTLVAQMKTGAQPDAYFSCDQTFLDMVAERFGPRRVIAKNDIVIVVPRGNPRAVTGLEDLRRPGLRIGVGHPEKSALGALTASLLRGANLDLGQNVVVESATGDFLINQLRTGSLDATLVYRSNAALSREHLDVVELGAAAATQPFAVAKDTAYPRLMERLLDAIESDASRARFEALGFEWLR